MGSVAVRGHQRGCRSADGAAVGDSFGQVASAAVGFAWPGYSLSARSLPRLATSGRPVWAGGLGTLGTPAGVGAAAAASAAVGARRSGHVEPDRERLGVLEQPNMDSDLIGRRIALGRRGPSQGELWSL